MVWNANWPVGTDSVAANRSTGQANTTYVKTTMNVDHFWDESTNQDGHHRYVQTEATNNADPSLATNPTLATEMDLVYYSRFKTATESVAQQDCQPFCLNNTDVMQLLGMRACVVWDISAGAAQTVAYGHNITSVTKVSTGLFTVSFANNLPSTDYLVLGGGLYSAGSIIGAVASTSISDVKTIGQCKVRTFLTSGSNINPNQGWFVFFGG